MRTEVAVSGLVALCAVVADASPLKPRQWGPPSGSPASVSNLKDKIKNVVVLMMENRSLDNLLGGQTTFGLDNPIHNGPFCNPLNISNPWQGYACSGASDYDEILDDPDHAIYGNNVEFYGTFTPDNDAIASGWLQPSMQGFPQEQIRLYHAKQNQSVLAHQVMHYYTEEQVPVLTALTKNFVTFNHWHSDIPGPTNPNRVSFTSGTSQGYGTNNFDLGAVGVRGIFQELTENGDHSWKNYISDPSTTTGPQALWYNWTYQQPDYASKVVPLAELYTDAAAGNLAEFTWIDPSCCGVGTTSMHPTGLVSDGETLIKSVYEALRASPQWDNLLFVLTFDETGGFHDHVAPPLAPRPDDLTYTAKTPNGQNYTFDFNRLGGRMPTWLISPWVAQAHVEQQSFNSVGEIVSYSASSFLRTAGYLWDFNPFTPRVEYAPAFDHLITSTFRDDTPETLPEVVKF